VKLFGGKEHLQRAPFADQPRQALRTAPARDKAECSAAMSEDGIRTGNASTARQSEIEPVAHAVAVNRSHGWGREVLDGLHQLLPHLRESKSRGAVEFGDFVKVGTGGEELSVAGNDKPFGRSRRELLDGFGQGEYAGTGKAISPILREEAQNGRVAAHLQLAQAS